MIMAISGRHCCSWGKKPNVMKRIFAGMMDQHAPALSRHCSLVEIQLLSIKAQLINGGIVFHRTKRVTSVSRELNHPLKRLVLIHPITPTATTGGFISSFSKGWVFSSMPLTSRMPHDIKSLF